MELAKLIEQLQKLQASNPDAKVFYFQSGDCGEIIQRFIAKVEINNGNVELR